MRGSAASSGTAGSTSSSLLRRVRLRDEDAWRRLSRIYGPLVYHWARRSGLHAADAADVLQNVLRALAEGIDSFRRDQPGDSFRGWLWGITRHKLMDHFRREKTSPTAIGALSHLPEELPAEDLAEEQAGILRRALELLDSEFEPHTRDAFLRTVVDGEDTRDVAADLGMTPKAVRQARYRVLRRLREELEDLL